MKRTPISSNEPEIEIKYSACDVREGVRRILYGSPLEITDYSRGNDGEYMEGKRFQAKGCQRSGDGDDRSVGSEN